MFDDDHPGPFWDLDFRTIINLIKAVEEPDHSRVHPDYRTGDDRDKTRFKDLMAVDFRRSFNERLSEMRAGINAHVPPDSRAGMLAMLANVLSAMASLAMVEYEVASTGKQREDANAGNSAKADRVRAIVRELVEEHRATHDGRMPTAAWLVTPLKKRCEGQVPPLRPVGREQIGRYLKEI